MITNVTSTSKIDTSSYSLKNDSKKTDKTTDKIEDRNSFQDLGADTFVKSTEESPENLTYKPIQKKLSSEEIEALKEEQANTEKELIKKFISDTINNQNKLFNNNDDTGLSKETTDLLTKIFGSIEKAYPKLATTPEGAQKAISDGGEYSVNAVADRIMTMATALAGDDEDKLQQMRDAVEEGFKQAGLVFKNATNSDLPQICKDTYTEVMNRFDKLQNKTPATTPSIPEKENKPLDNK